MRVLIGLLTVVWLLFNVVNAGQSQFDVIQVMPGDTVWKIAEKHSTARQDIREVVSAIRQMNQLDHNGQIHPGQSLKVPVAGK